MLTADEPLDVLCIIDTSFELVFGADIVDPDLHLVSIRLLT